MNFFSTLGGEVVWLWLLPCYILLVLTHQFFKPFYKRFSAPTGVTCQLDSNVYHEFQQIEVYGLNGRETADYVYVSPYGIFVVNTPSQEGFITGKTDGAFWLAKRYNAETPFPNPLLENQQRIRFLSQQLGIMPNLFYSVVVFPKQSQLLDMMPDNVLEASDFQEYVAQYQEHIFNKEEVAQIKISLESSKFDTVFKYPSPNV